MSEVTWLMILGAIAIITPIVILGLNDYVGNPTDDLVEQIREQYGLYFNETEYNLIQNITCSNVFDENSLGITNYALLDNNRFIYFYPEDSSWIYSPYISIACVFNENHVSDKINETLLSEAEVIAYFNEEINKETDDGKTRSFISTMNPNRFFEVLNQFPESIKYFIYTFYTLFFGYLIVKAVTLL